MFYNTLTRIQPAATNTFLFAGKTGATNLSVLACHESMRRVGFVVEMARRVYNWPYCVRGGALHGGGGAA